jgi:hypothetical protein
MESVHSHVAKDVLRLERLVLHLGKPERHLPGPRLGLVASRGTAIAAATVAPPSIAVGAIAPARGVLRSRGRRRAPTVGVVATGSGRVATVWPLNLAPGQPGGSSAGRRFAEEVVAKIHGVRQSRAG